MAQIRWTEKALDDLEAILEYISMDSFSYAELFAKRVFKAVEKLEDFPNIGRVLPEIEDENLGEIIFGNYRLIYRRRQKENLVEIIAVHHSSMSLSISFLSDLLKEE